MRVPKLLTPDICWDIDQLRLSPAGLVCLFHYQVDDILFNSLFCSMFLISGDRLAFITNEDGISQVYVMDMTTNNYIKLPDVPMGLAYSLRWHPAGDRIGLVINTPQTPGDIFVLTVPSNTHGNGTKCIPFWSLLDQSI